MFIKKILWKTQQKVKNCGGRFTSLYQYWFKKLINETLISKSLQFEELLTNTFSDEEDTYIQPPILIIKEHTIYVQHFIVHSLSYTSLTLSLQLHNEIEVDNLEVEWMKYPAPNPTACILVNMQSYNFFLLVHFIMTCAISYIIKRKQATKFRVFHSTFCPEYLTTRAYGICQKMRKWHQKKRYKIGNDSKQSDLFKTSKAHYLT